MDWIAFRFLGYLFGGACGGCVVCVFGGDNAKAIRDTQNTSYKNP
jgi:hypothetical protein